MFAIIALAIGGYYLSPYKLVGIAKGDVKQVASQADESVIAKEDKKVTPTKIERVAATTTNNNKPENVTQKSAEQNNVQASVSHETTPEPEPEHAAVALIHQAAPATVSKTVAAVKHVASVSSPASKPALQGSITRINDSKQDQSDNADDFENNAEISSHVVTKQQRKFTPDEKSRQLYANAMSLYDQGNKQEAKSSLVQALASNPGNADASRLLTVIYLEDGRADLASSTVEAGLKVHGSDQNLLRLYVQTLAKLKKYNQAISVMRQRIQLTSPEDLGYLAGLYQKNNDHLSAVRYYSEALQIVPGKSIWWLGQGISLEILKQYKESLASYKKAVNTGELSTKLMEYAISRIYIVKQRNADS